MPNLKTNLQVGIFMGLGLLVILGTIFLLGSQSSLMGGNYTIKGTFKQTQGLFSGSTITFSGIKVGNVGKIVFDPAKGVVVVTLKIKNEFKSLITGGAKASIKTQGALGDKFVYISPGEPGKPPLNDQEFIDTDEPADLFDLVAEKTKDLSQVIDLIAEVRALVKGINDNNRVGTMMGNLEASSHELKMVLRDVRGDKQELKAGIEHFSSILRKIDEGEGTLGALINDKSLHNRISAMVGANPAKSYIKPLIRATIKEPSK